MTYFAINVKSGNFIDGITHVYNTAPERFSMILSTKEKLLPQMVVMLGGTYQAWLF